VCILKLSCKARRRETVLDGDGHGVCVDEDIEEESFLMDVDDEKEDMKFVLKLLMGPGPRRGFLAAGD
jgi:hypothetical protein